MSAQYRPYRDEDSVDGLETAAWSDHEPGSIQIYEKTTEELPFNPVNKRALWLQIAMLVTIGLLGFLLGFFASYHPPIVSSSLDADSDTATGHERYSQFYVPEDQSIRGKLLSNIGGHHILKILESYKDTDRKPGDKGDDKFASNLYELFTEFGFDHVTSENQTFSIMLPSRPSVIKLLTKENKTIYSNVEHEKYSSDEARPLLALSQANATTFSTNQILYVNRGTKDDFAKLSSLGISSKETEDKVLIMRQQYHQAHDNIINAQENDAKAILLFPDPDVFGDNSPFPSSVKLPNDAGKSHPTAWSNYGDLASFNISWGSSPGGIDITKLGLDKESGVRIPVIPISYNTAKKILRGLTGPLAPNEWNCFDFTLYLGPGYRDENNEDQRNKIEIEFHNEKKVITTTTVTGVISGSVEPDRYVLVGSRRDSLNQGMLDSVSGTAVMFEIARAYGLLKKRGWRPRRSIVFSSFGSESLNLIGSSNFLDAHHRLLQARAVAYLNCDMVVTGNRTVNIAASPLLHHVLFNATRQVSNPNKIRNLAETVYDDWLANHNSTSQLTVAEWDEVLDENSGVESKLPPIKSHDDTNTIDEDTFGSAGNILSSYKKAALVKTRPLVRHLDLHSIYSPFFLYLGIPVVDVRYSGFPETKTNTSNRLLDDMIPLVGTKYDNLQTIQRIDPHLKYHVAVAQIMAEIIRDLSDSVFLPFNLLEYAVTLKDCYSHFAEKFKDTFTRSGVDLDHLKQVIIEFSKAALKFHHRQDLVDPKDSMAVRKFNDQLMMLERTFLDGHKVPHYLEKKHMILTPNDGQDRKEGFPGLVDWLSLLDNELPGETETVIFDEMLKIYYKTVVFTIRNAIKTIDEAFMI